jgi:acetolactate synthase-1/2/3 large subunit
MNDRTGGDIVLEALTELDVDTVFAVASIHNLPILDAIRRRGGVRVVNMRHEQSVMHAADGYSRATGRLGVGLTSTGPGAANAMGGLFEAGFASSRVLMITGQVETRFYGQGKGFLHEAESQLPMLRSVTRETWSVRRVEDIGESVLAAGRAAQTGRPQPTAVEIPVNLQYQTSTIELPPSLPVVPTAALPERIAQAALLIAQAKRPLIWAGGGVVSSGAWDELRHLAERLDIPVVTSTQGRGALPEDHPLCLGSLMTSPPVRSVVEEADLVLAVGTHFQMYDTGFWEIALTPNLVHVDVDPTVIGRNYPAAVAVVADAVLALRGLDEAVASSSAEPDWSERAKQAAREARSARLTSLGDDHRAIVDLIRTYLPDDGAVVRDATIPAYNWGNSLLPIVTPRTSMHPASAAIGPGLPLAIGATIGRGARSVVIHGDGGIMLTIGELSSLAQANAPLTVLVFNDGGYGILRGIQAATFGEATERNDVDLSTPDFVELARAMHIPAERVESIAEFEKVFASSVESEGPNLIEIDLHSLAPMNVPISAQEILG